MLISTSEGELLRITSDGTISRERFTMHQDDFYEHWYGFRAYDNNRSWHDPFADCRSDDEHYLQLLELSSCYSGDPEDILWDAGCSYDEIEAFLPYPESCGAELANNLMKKSAGLTQT